MKKIIVLLLVLCTAFTLFAGGDKEEAADGTHRFCFIVTGGRLGDQANNDAGWEGISAFCNEENYECKAIELDEVSDVDRTVREMVAEGYDCFLFNSSDAVDILDDLCPDFPDCYFIQYNGTNENGYANLTNIRVDVAGGGFLTAICGALMNERINGQRLVGYIGGTRNPNLERVRFGMQAGAAIIGGECVPTYVGSFSDATKAKEIAQQMHSNGVEVIQAWAGGANKGVFEAAETAGEGHLSMAGATGQFHMSQTIFASLATRIDEIFKQLCKEYVNGTIQAGYFEASATNGMVDCIYSPREGVEAVPDDIKAIVDEYRQKIVSGELEIPKTEEEYSAFIEKFAN